MMIHERRSSSPLSLCWQRFLLVLLGAMCGTCSSDDRLVILVTVQGRMPDVKALYVSAMLNGKPAMQGDTISMNLDTFAVRLPNQPDSLGSLEVDVDGLGNNGCKAAGGNVTINIGPDQMIYQAVLSLVPMMINLCRVTVTPTGAGTVTSAPPGINCSALCAAGDSCSQCSAYLPYGAADLTATPTGASYDVEWGGDCVVSGVTFGNEIGTSSTCHLSLMRPQVAPVNFGALTLVTSSTKMDLAAIWATDANNVGVVGTSGTVLWCSGTSCTSVNSGTTNNLQAVWASDTNNLWAVGYSGIAIKCGKTSCDLLKNIQMTFPLYSIWGSDANNIWIVGGNYAAYNCSDSACTKIDINIEPYSVWGSDSNDVWIAGKGALNHNINFCDKNKNCHSIYSSNSSAFPLAMWASGASAWAVGQSGNSYLVVNCSRTSCSEVSTGDLGSVSTLWGVTQNNESRIWAVGSGSVITCSRQTCSRVTTNAHVKLNAVWGLDANRIWVVGDSGTVLVCNSSSCTTLSSGTTANLRAVRGVDANKVWAVGDGGTIIRFGQ